MLSPLLDTSCQKQDGTSEANRLFINAVLWRTRTGVPWRDMPERPEKWNSPARWANKKVWHRLFAAIQEPGWNWVLVDSTSVKTQ